MYVILTSRAKMPSFFGSMRYKRIGLIHLERAWGVVSVVETWERLFHGKTERCAFHRAYAEATRLRDEHNLKCGDLMTDEVRMLLFLSYEGPSEQSEVHGVLDLDPQRAGSHWLRLYHFGFVSVDGGIWSLTDLGQGWLQRHTDGSYDEVAA